MLDAHVKTTSEDSQLIIVGCNNQNLMNDRIQAQMNYLQILLLQEEQALDILNNQNMFSWNPFDNPSSPQAKDWPTGCFFKDSECSNSAQYLQPLPLTKATYQIDIFNALSEVTLFQEYQNFTNKFLQISYRFPVPPTICLHKFSATFSNKRIQGRVKEKEEAKKQYRQAVSQGKKAAYGEVDSESKDLMTIQIGNIPPQQKVTIEISYIEELTLSLNTFYRFSLPVKNSPRYLNNIPKNKFAQAFKSKIQVQGREFSWDFRLRLRSSKKIVSFNSASHQIDVEAKNDVSTDIAITFKKGFSLSKDFVFSYSTQEFQLPSYTLGRTDAGSSVVVSFIPKFCALSLSDAQNQALKSQDFQTDMDSVRGQYIFLLDRSGSMGGNRIAKAKAALVLFLKSLPVDSYFNVVSFGSSSSKLSPQSFRNSSQSVNLAVSKVQSMSADLGGTEIQNPLRNILVSKVIHGYPKQIFLLTDGEVQNTERVIDLVRKNIKYSRVHTIGIGDGASQALIKGCAEKGKGHHIFIKDSENPAEKIIQLLNDSLTPVISKVDLSYDKSIVKSITPNPRSMPYILKGQVANFYLTFNGQLDKATTISLKYKDSANNLPFQSDAEINPQSPSEPFIATMAHHKQIRALEECEESQSVIENYLYYVKIVDRKKEIIQQSIRHQVLSKYTAFVCVEQQLVDGKYQEIKEKGQLSIQLNLQDKVKHQKEKYQFGCTSTSLRYHSTYGISAPPIPSPQLPPPLLPGSLPMSASSASYRQKSLDDLLFGCSKAPLRQTKPSSSQPIENLQQFSFGGNSSSFSSPPPPPPTSGLASYSQPASQFTSIVPPPPPALACISAPPAFNPSKIFGGMGMRRLKQQKQQKNNFQGSAPKRGLLLDQDDQGQNVQQYFGDFCFQKKSNEGDLLSLDAVIDFSAQNDNVEKKRKKEKQKSQKDKIETSQKYDIKKIVAQQSFEGFWSDVSIVASLYDLSLAESIQKKGDVTAIVTYLIVRWIDKHHPEADYMLIRKKAWSWLKKQKNFGQLSGTYDIYIQ